MRSRRSAKASEPSMKAIAPMCRHRSMPSFNDQLRDEYLNVEASFDHLSDVKEKLEPRATGNQARCCPTARGVIVLQRSWRASGKSGLSWSHRKGGRVGRAVHYGDAADPELLEPFV